MYERVIKNQMQEWLDSREIIILKGARQTGKTTLVQQLFGNEENAIILNCENPSVAAILESFDIEAVKALFESKKLIALDEAQTIANIGKLLKLIYDELPEYKIIVTGSSSFELLNQIGEPLTGRNVKFNLYPLSLEEIRIKHGWLHVVGNLNSYLVFGLYPGIIDIDSNKRQKKLLELAGDYLFKDILIYDQIKSPAIVRKLLRTIALQVGSEVSVNELSNMLGMTRSVVESHLDILEKNFIVFKLESYSRNLRNEIRKGKKYYFYDNGIMNAVTGNLNPVQNRNDAGVLWENFCVAERLKFNHNNDRMVNMHFWRTYDHAEIDLVESQQDILTPFEFKWHEKRKPKMPASFVSEYNVQKLNVISPATLYKLIDR